MIFSAPQMSYIQPAEDQYVQQAEVQNWDEGSENSRHWELTQTILYWKAKEQRLQYTNQSAPIDTTTDFTQNKRVRPHFEWDLGFRETLAYLPDECSGLYPWYFDGSWTFIKNEAKGHKKTDESEGIFPIQSILPDTAISDFVFEARTKWNVRLNVAEGRAIYRYKPASYFFLFPYVGLKAAWINQKIKTRYEGGSLIAGPEKVHMRNNSFGIGPEVGLKPFFVFGNEWHLYAFVSYAPLVSWFHTKQEDNYAVNSSHKNKHFCDLISTLDSGAGLEWLISFSRDRYLLGLQAGYEYHIYFSEYRLPNGPLDLLTGNRNLTFRGWTFSVTIGF